jgi:hypothetical protein
MDKDEGLDAYELREKYKFELGAVLFSKDVSDILGITHEHLRFLSVIEKIPCTKFNGYRYYKLFDVMNYVDNHMGLGIKERNNVRKVLFKTYKQLEVDLFDKVIGYASLYHNL